MINSYFTLKLAKITPKKSVFAIFSLSWSKFEPYGFFKNSKNTPVINEKLRDKTWHYVDNAFEVLPGHYKPAWGLERIRAPPGPYVQHKQYKTIALTLYTTKHLLRQVRA